MFIYGERPRFDLTSTAKGGEPSSLGDIADTTFEAMRVVDNANSSRIANERAYDDRIDGIFQATGQRLENPERVDIRHKLAKHGSFGPMQGEYPDPHAEFQTKLNELSTEMPQFRDVIAPDRPIRADALKKARDAEHKALDVWERADGGFSSWASRLAGGFYGAMHDPVNVATLMVGPTKPAQAGIKGLLWMGLKQGAANAGTEAAIQPFVQAWRGEAGLDHGVSLAAMNIGLSGLFGFGADAAVRSTIRGGRRLAGRPYRGPDPVPPIEALDAVAKVAPPESVLRRAADGDEQALRDLARETGQDNDPLIKHMLDEVEAERLFPVPDRVDGGEHLSSLARAVREASGTVDDLPAGDAIMPTVTREMSKLADEAVGEALQIEGKAVGFRSIDPREIEADPNTFQFKSGGNEEGVTDRLRGVTRWDPVSAGKAIVFERAPRRETPIAQFRRDAEAIEASLPPVTEGNTRLWRGNRPGEVGTATRFTNDLAGIAIPFRKGYDGDLSYVDVPTADLQKYLQTTAAAKDAEFIVPSDIAAKATVAKYVSGRQPAGQFVIADGHQRRNLALRSQAQGHNARLDAYVFREVDGWTPEDVRAYAALKNMRESSGNALDMAQVMRERPDLIDGSLPLSDAKLREATMLARLSPAAFDAVLAGRLPPGYAALIGESVTDTSRHIGLLDELAEAGLSNSQQARLYLKQSLDLPTTTEIQHTLFGEEAFTRTVFRERVKVLDAALKTLRSDKRIFSLLEREAASIEGLGNVLAREANQVKADKAAMLGELIERLATSRGMVATILNDAAASVARGYNPTLASRAFVARIADTLDRDGINGLLRADDRIEADLNPRPMEDPMGPEAKAQTDEVEAILEQESLFAIGSRRGPRSPKPSDQAPEIPDAMQQDLFRAAWFDSIQDLRFLVTGRTQSQIGDLEELPIFERRRDRFTGDARAIVDRLEGNIRNVVEAYDAGDKPIALEALNDAVEAAQTLRAAVAGDETLRLIANLLTQDIIGAAKKHIFNFGKAAPEEGSMFALRGFYSPAIRAAEQISQAKGTGEQFWKQITKVPGVRKDELDWMGLEEFLKDKPSITKAEVLEFMRAHQVELDEKVLGGGGKIEKTLSEISASDAPDYLAKAERVWSYKVGGFQYFIGHFPESSRPYRLTDFEGSSLGDVASVDAARHIADGDANAENAGGTKFGDYKVPGGENYRELLIRLPELGEPQGAASAELNKRLDDLRAQRRAIENGDVPATREQERAVGEEIARTIKELAPKYTSKHFADQEIVHLRVDDRTGPNGEKVLFVNEVQSDLHQAGRTGGYRDEGKDVEFRDISALERQRDEAWADVVRLGSRPEAAAARLRHDELRAEIRRLSSQTDEELKNLQRVPDAPFKGDLWLELAMKRALLYASENGYDAVSWARSDQIAKAVGAEPEKLALQYDQKIGKFLDKYTKKWGGKVEQNDLKIPKLNPDDGFNRGGIFEEFNGNVDAALQAFNESPYRFVVAESEVAPTRKWLEMLNSAPAENPLLRITPQMRASVLEGQPLSVPNAEAMRPATLRSSTLSENAAAQMADIRAEIDKAVSRSLPVGWRAEVRQNMVFGDLPESLQRRNPGVPPSLEIEGTFDPYEKIIYVSMAALDPVDRAYEEAGHALKALRLVPEADYGILRAKALEIDARTRFNIDERYGEVYGERWKDNPERLEAALEEEAIMQMVAARARGDDFGKPVNAIMDKLIKFFRAIRDMLGLKGFRSFDDVFEDMTGGGFARQMDQQIQMRGGDEAMAAATAKTADGPLTGDEFLDRFGFEDETVFERIPFLIPDELKNELLFVEVRNGKVVGATGIQQSPSEPDVFWSKYTSVDQDYRNQGIAKSLIERKLAFVREQKKLLKLSSMTDDGEAFLSGAYEGVPFVYGQGQKKPILADAYATKSSSGPPGESLLSLKPLQSPSQPDADFIQKAGIVSEAMFALGNDKSAKMTGGRAAKQIRELVNGAAARGELSREDADALIKRYDSLERQHKDADKAKAQLAQEIDANAAHRKRQKALSEAARTRAEATLVRFRDARGQADPAKAMVAMIENLGQHELPEGTLSVANHQRAIFGLAMADLDALLHEHRKTIITGQTRDKAGLRNVVRELFREETGDEKAKAFAAAAAGVMEKMRQRFNAAGGAIGQRQDWGLPQAHDQVALIRAGKEAWSNYIAPLLDPERMRHPLTGNPLTKADLKTSLDWIYDNIVSDGWHEKEARMAFQGLGSVANQRGDQRFLVFRDADSWMKYADQFGNGGDPLAVMVNHIRGMSEDIAAMEVLGPNPRAMLTYMQQFVEQQAARRAAKLPAVFPAVTEVTGREFRPHGNKFTSRDPREYARRMNERADNMWNIYRGATSAQVGDTIAEVSQTIRNVNVATKLGSATLSALADPFWQLAARKFAGLPVTKVISDAVRQLAPGGEREARRAGIIADTYLHMHNEQAREAASLSATKVSGFLAERVISLSMLGTVTRAGNHAMSMGIQGFLADQTGKAFGQLDGAAQRLLRRHGIAEGDWDAIRLDANGSPIDADFLTPALINDASKARGGDSRLAERYLAMTIYEAQYATTTGTLRAKAMALGNTRAGTGVGEIWRHLAQFKSFAINIAILQIERMAREFVSQGLWRGAQYGAYALMAATLGGAMVIQLKQLKDGKDPRDMTKPEFWGNAAYQSGGLSIWGDLLYASENRMGGGISGTIAGPTASTVQDLINVTYGAAKKNLVGTEKGETNFGRELAKTVRNYTPGSSLWYLRLAWNRVLMDNLQRTLDPQAEAAFRRQIQNAKKNYKQDMWWKPGRAAPSRAPDIRAAVPALQ
jgi:GNAT superfamily N-acetyltransferase